MEFAESSGSGEWQGELGLEGHANYFVGADRNRWRTDVPLFNAARLRDIETGIDCVAYARTDGIELDFEVAPGADVRMLRMRLSGPGKIERNSAGDLNIRRADATLRLGRPAIYQITATGKVPVVGSYEIGPRRTISFRVPHYERTRPLVIDSSVSLTYTTFLGGTDSDSASSVAADASGNVYISGTAQNVGFPESGTVLGPGGATDFFVAKLNPAQTGAASLIYLTFIGGSDVEGGGELALNSTGELAVAGATTSSDYPVTDKTSLGSSANALALSVISASGNSLVFSTLLAGNGAEGTQSEPSVAFMPSGDIAVDSDTTSTNLPVTSGAYQTQFGSGDSPPPAAMTVFSRSIAAREHWPISAIWGLTAIPTRTACRCRFKWESPELPSICSGMRIFRGLRLSQEVGFRRRMDFRRHMAAGNSTDF